LELIVTVAIIAVFSGVVLTAITSVSNHYRNTSNNAKVQMETQDTLDMLQNLIIDANDSIYYAYLNDIDTDVNKVDKILYVYNQDSYNTITWKSEENKLYYSQLSYSAKDAENKTSADSDFTDALLAEDITDFRVDVTKVESNQIVRFQITTEKQGKSITTTHTVHLRNQIKLAEEGELPEGTTSQNLSIKITYYPDTMTAKDSVLLQFKAEGIDPTTVSWSVISGPGAFDNDSFSLLRIADTAAEGDIVTVMVSAKDKTNTNTVNSAAVSIRIVSEQTDAGEHN
jgi:type II secretory pathway pseudopilin PulG